MRNACWLEGQRPQKVLRPPRSSWKRSSRRTSTSWPSISGCWDALREYSGRGRPIPKQMGADLDPSNMVSGCVDCSKPARREASCIQNWMWTRPSSCSSAQFRAGDAVVAGGRWHASAATRQPCCHLSPWHRTRETPSICRHAVPRSAEGTPRSYVALPPPSAESTRSTLNPTARRNAHAPRRRRRLRSFPIK